MLVSHFSVSRASQAAQSVENLPVNAGDAGDAGSISGSGRSLPGESHGQRSLAGYSP